MEKHTVSRCSAHRPVTGYEEGGQLTEKVRHAVLRGAVRRDREGAPGHLQLAAADPGGRALTDAQGRVVDFKNTVIIMTRTWAPRTSPRASIGFGTASESSVYDRMKSKSARLGSTSAWFLNRVDDTIVFHQLSQKRSSRSWTS